MNERQVTQMGGNDITLVGPQLRVGDQAPDFMVIDPDLMPKTLEDYQDRIKLINTVVSLETGVGDAQTRKFDEFAADFSEDVTVLTISMDLPFAQKRWRNTAGIERVELLSDHRLANFGEEYGILIKELRLLNRSVIIVDKDNIVRYVEIVEENHNHPDYGSALEALKSIH
jgi:thiol peroxidase